MGTNEYGSKFVFPGNNFVFCFNRLIISKYLGSFAISMIMLLGAESLFIIFEYPFILLVYSYALLIPECILFVYCIVLMFKTAFTDPGFIRRDTLQDRARHLKSVEFYFGAEARYKLGEEFFLKRRIKDVIVNSRYCQICEYFRPPRCSHCSVCNACSYKLDHHCPWLGNCVAERNYIYFFLLIVIILILVLYHIILICIHLAHVHSLLLRNSSITIANIPSMINLLFHAIIFFLISGLVYYHFNLVVYNMTTIEDFKKTMIASGSNPFNDDGLMKASFKNLLQFFGRPKFISALDMRERSKMKMYCKETTAYELVSSVVPRKLYEQIAFNENDYLLQDNSKEGDKAPLKYTRV